MQKSKAVPYLEVLFRVIVQGASLIATKVINDDITFPIKSYLNVVFIKESD